MRRLLAALLVTGAFNVGASATDIPISARTLSILDTNPADPAATIKFVARDLTAGISKGTGIDPSAIAATIAIAWDATAGAFDVPAGVRAAGTNVGWSTNTATVAKFGNGSAATGVPTGMSSLVVTEGKGLKFVARTAGDVAIDLSTATLPAFGIQVVTTITNGSERLRHCTVFPRTAVTLVNVGAGRKLTAKNGLARECPPEPMSLTPAPALPSTPAGPSLWFDGGNPAEVAAILARTTHGETSGLYASITGTVNGALAGLGVASDDTKALVAKGAGLLHVTGSVPPGGSGYASYRDVVVAAITTIGDRTAGDTLAEFITPPPNLLDVLRDAGRLQSIAEAYDLVRGSGVAPIDDAAMRTRIANWADEYRLDWNLLGDPFGFFEGHRDNWAIKAGSAVVTAALALPDHPNAGLWLADGLTWIDESLAAVVRGPGWYAESHHYLNYALNNLVSTAWHVRNATGVDWFDDLEPFVDTAFATRQPDGRHPPFEEGVTNTFPWDVLAAAYPARAPTMMWALAESPGDFSAYENQQFHTVTRFLVRALDVAIAAPTAPPTTFHDGDTHLVALRSDWTDAAVALFGMTAIDGSADETFASRHHMENPLDVVLYGGGALVLPTASGGPTVTTSPNRAYYLLPSSKNIPLVDGNAPYVLEPLALTLDDRLDSQDAGATAHRALDAATTTVEAFAPGVAVTRTLGLVGDAYGVVVDHFASDASHAYGLTWRGRGDATLRAATAGHVASDTAWPSAGAPVAHLAIDATSSAPLTGGLGGGFYAPTFGTEEALSPLGVSTTATSATILTVMRPRADATPASTFTPIAVPVGAAGLVVDGTATDVLLAGPVGPTVGAAGLTMNGRFALARTIGTTLTALAGIRTTNVATGGASITSDTRATFAATLAPGTVVLTVGGPTSGAVRFTLSALPSLDPSPGHTVTFDGTPLAAPSIIDLGATIVVTVPGPGVLVVTDA